MPNVEFEDETKLDASLAQISKRSFDQGTRSTFAKLIIKWGLAESENGANKVLIGFSIFCLLLALWFFGVFNFLKKKPTAVLPPQPASLPSETAPQ